VHLLGDARELDRRHYKTLTRVADARTGATFELPRGLCVTVDPDVIIISIGAMPSSSIPPSVEHQLPWTGDIGAWHVDVEPNPRRSSSERLRDRGGFALGLPANAVIRGGRHGDVVRTAAGHKKLSDYLIDRKVPRRERQGAPVIATAGRVHWTPHARDLLSESGEPFIVTAISRSR
jgi:tRNA(Ile)-lysidine synthetase-like protein